MDAALMDAVISTMMRHCSASAPFRAALEPSPQLELDVELDVARTQLLRLCESCKVARRLACCLSSGGCVYLCWLELVD